MNNHKNKTREGVFLVEWFVRNPVAANLLMVVILAVGIVTAFSLRIEGFPSLDPSAITIEVGYESGNVRQAEEAVATRIEEALKGTPGVETITSTSTTTGVTVVVKRVDGYDLDRLNTDIKSQVDGISAFPAAAEKPIVSRQLWDESALWVAVYGEVDQASLQHLAARLERELLSLPDVNNINRTGWKQPEIAIEIDEQQLQAYGLTLESLAEIINRESLSVTSGELRSADGTILLKADRQRYFQRDFADILLATFSDGSTLRLGDVAEIRDGFEETPHVLSRFQGKPAINLEVQIGRDTNIVEISEQTQALVKEFREGHQLPPNIGVEVWWNQSVSMLERLDLMLKNGLIGITLVMIVLAVFLNLRVAFWVGMGLPVSFAGGFILMGPAFFDLTLNQLTTFGFMLVLGVLVDDSLVIGESVYTARRQYGDSPESTILGVNRVAVPTVYGLLTTVAAFYPLTLISGRLGSLFSQFALICTACLLFSLVESKLILPAHLAHVKTTRGSARTLPGKALEQVQSWADSGMTNLNQRLYRPLLRWALNYRYAVVTLFLSVFILVVGMLPSGKIGFHFFPDIPEDFVTVTYTVESGAGSRIAHQQAERVQLAVDTLKREWREYYPGHADVIAHTYVLVSNDRQGSVTLELSSREGRVVESMDVADRLTAALTHNEGVQELLVSVDDHSDKDFVLNVLSDNREQVSAAALLIQETLSSLQGVVDLHNNMATGQSQLVFELTEEGRARGMTTEYLAQQIQQAFYGVEVQRIQRGREEIKVRVRYPRQQRQDITALQDARVRTPDGAVLPLSTVAIAVPGYTINEVNHIDGHLAATVSANIDEKRTSSEDVLQVLENTVYPVIHANYPEVRVVPDGDLVEEEKSMNSLVLIFAFSLFLIYILVAIPLKSYWQPLIIMSAIPFGIVGAVLGHWFNDLAITILSINGILALSGVVVNDSLLLVNRYNELRSEGLQVNDALIEAGSQRMRAIILTSLTTSLGLVSLMQETSEQAQFLIPPAVSLAYGIVFATLVSLVLIPILISITNDLIKRFRISPADIPGQLVEEIGDAS
ncbi:MAG: efflux RND transporter permease subunit [Candidatus Thiodiazotropha sp.]